MKFRELKYGEGLCRELEHSQILIIKTKAPRKWILKDLETGQEYRGSEKPGAVGTHWEDITDYEQLNK